MNDWKKVVSAVAPILGTALGGPLGGAAAKLVSIGLLGKEGASDTDISKALLDPDNLIKLKSVELDFEKRMKELDIDLVKIGAKDRASARGLAEKTGITPQVVISSIFIGGFFVVLWVLFSGAVVLTDSMEKLAYLLLGVLASGITMILKFWFGGSPNDAETFRNIHNSIPREHFQK